MTAPAPVSERVSTDSSAYADSGKHASWGRSSDGGSSSKRGSGTVSRRRTRKSGGFLMGNFFQPRPHETTEESPSKPRAQDARPEQKAPPMGGIDGTPTMSQASLDPSQLVQMALSLSEGRRRHVSASLQVPTPSNDKRRVRSSGAPVIQVSPGSPMGNDFFRRASVDPQYHPSFQDDSSFLTGEEEVDYHFSGATLHRAERARKFFELSSEYRRLLCHLPPLKPANIQESPRSVQDQKELGRQYNPLQLLRNRKARHREQRPLDPPVDAYDDVSKVKSYIDQVESEASDATYRACLDTSLLPSFRRPSRGQDEAPAPTTRSHKRSDTAVSNIIRPENDWSFTPAELLADAVWLLQLDNRCCIENRHGHRIFPPRPRSSFESTRSGRKSVDSRPSMTRTNTWGSAIKSDEETDRGRKRPKFLSLRHVDNTARKHLFRNRSRSSSASSVASNRPRNRKKQYLGPGNDLDIENTGPLERQMKKLIEKDEQENLGVEAESPELISPDKWDRGHTGQSLSPIADSPAVNAHKRNESYKTDESVNADDRHRSSYDGSTAPSSPALVSHIPSFGMSLSPPASRTSSPERRFGLFRSSRNPSDDKINRTDFAATSQSSLPSSRQVSDNMEQPRSSFESFRPQPIKRHRTTNSITNTLFNSSRHNSKEVKDGGVGRFFKGGRIGDLVRSDSSRQNEAARKKEQLAMRNMSDSETDPEDQDETLRKMPPANRSRTTIVGATPKEKEKEKQRFHLPTLPSFKPSNHVNDSDVDQDPIARQNKLHREGSKNSRFSKLAPPRINLPKEDRSVSPSGRPPLSRYSSEVSDTDLLTPLRKTRTTHQPGVFEASLPTISTSSSPARRPSPGKRHWSISDRGPSSTPSSDSEGMTTTIDIARVRALYLSTGVKAQEIIRRANSPAIPPSPFFTKAAETVNAGVHPVTLREEFTVAARMLHKPLTSKSSSLNKSLTSFRSSRIPDLHTRLEDLRHKVDEKFTPLVHSTADEAEAFTVALTTQYTLAIKQVNDAADNLVRRRRRNLIFLQRVSWTILEWFVLGIMWVVWFVVVIVRFCKGVVMGGVGGARWLLGL